MAESARLAGPVDESERSQLLDALRGWALFGILLANIMVFSGWVFLGPPERAAAALAGFDGVLEFAAEWLVIGKFYAIFSLLFGIGFAIQIERLERRGEGIARYARRLAILFLFGLAHMLLLWIGDIVALYALMGGFLLLFRQASDRALLWWAAALWLVPVAWSAAIHFAGLNLHGPVFGFGVATIASVGIDPSASPNAVFADPDILVHLKAHPGEIFFRIGDLLYQMRFTKVLAMFLIGLWIGRKAIYARPDAFRPLLRKTAIAGLGLGLPLSAAKAVLTMWPGDPPPAAFAAEVFYCLGTPTLALGYVAAFTLLWVNGRTAIASWATPAGRMALTNYLMQSLLQSAVFYGWGLGLVGTVSLAVALAVAVPIFALQVAYSRWWLDRHRFGPAEWLWRSLTYGQVQPMRRATA